MHLSTFLPVCLSICPPTFSLLLFLFSTKQNIHFDRSSLPNASSSRLRTEGYCRSPKALGPQVPRKQPALFKHSKASRDCKIPKPETVSTGLGLRVQAWGSGIQFFGCTGVLGSGVPSQARWRIQKGDP